MSNPGLSPEHLAEAATTLAALRCHLDDVPLDTGPVAALLEQLSWLQGELRKRRRREQRALEADTGPVARRCYACKQPTLDGPLCANCAAHNGAKRDQTADCHGLVALLTGGRVKIGYQVGLKLLRAGAEVIVTTRFPRDAARRYSAELDAAGWADRLHVLPLDLRHLPAVEQFAASFAERWPRLDIFVHNAAQTVRRPPAFYRHLLDAERLPPGELPASAQLMLASAAMLPSVETNLSVQDSSIAWSVLLSQVPMLPGDSRHDEALFPPGLLDADGQQVDRRPLNSWHWLLPQVPTIELVEVHLVNCIAPFVLLRSLLPLFRAGEPRARFAVMVSSAEGRFNTDKAPRHPHTNMAKAALNMLVRTAAADLARERIHLTAVDPGWVSLEFAEPAARELEASGTRPPLDTVDSAARILDPVFSALNGAEPMQGVLLKDYQPAAW
jgi:NAD(P)-dependent dehydrogenase (short-subunit alcohol dehydrogenase family)